MKINILLAISSLFLTIVSCNQNAAKLPILGNREIAANGKDTIYQTIPDFNLLNQDSIYINNDSLKDKIYVADFFFTSCPSICPIMKKQLLRIHDKYKDNNQVAIVSHTIDPKHDSVPVLKKYADKLGVSSKKWHFLYGARDVIYNMARNGYMNYADRDSLAPGGISHSGYFILVDKNRHIRGAYDGTDEKQVSQLMDDMDILLAEYK